MIRKNKPSEDYENRYSDTYQTGATQPPRSRGGLVAFLLGLVIFLCGISTAMGLMNIRLFHALQNRSGADTVEFSQATAQTVTAEDSDFFSLGFRGQTVPDFWNRYDALPNGVYVTEVCASAGQQGLRPGDILTAVDGVAVDDGQALTAILEGCKPGQKVLVSVYREGTTAVCQLTCG